MTSGSATAFWAFSASLPASHAPLAAVASSRSSYVSVKLPALLFASSSAILIEFTMVSVWPFEEPVRGSDDTILIVVALPAPAGAEAAVVVPPAAAGFVAAPAAPVAPAAGVVAPPAAPVAPAAGVVAAPPVAAAAGLVAAPAALVVAPAAGVVAPPAVVVAPPPAGAVVAPAAGLVAAGAAVGAAVGLAAPPQALRMAAAAPRPLTRKKERRETGLTKVPPKVRSPWSQVEMIAPRRLPVT